MAAGGRNAPSGFQGVMPLASMSGIQPSPPPSVPPPLGVSSTFVQALERDVSASLNISGILPTGSPSFTSEELYSLVEDEFSSDIVSLDLSNFYGNNWYEYQLGKPLPIVKTPKVPLANSCVDSLALYRRRIPNRTVRVKFIQKRNNCQILVKCSWLV